MTVYLAHATSFCRGVWRPVVEHLGSIPTVAWDFAGHGAGPELHLPVDWRVFGAQVLDETRPGGIGVGHSMGAAALVMAQLTDPARFKALILIEPIIFPGPYARSDHPLSEKASDRRASFDTRQEAAQHFRSRPVFAGWDPAAVDGYLECGLVGETPVTLACRPEVEADIYRGSRAHDTWESLGQIEVPVLILAGADSDTISPGLTRDQSSRFARAGFEIIEGAGHFLSMEKPRLVADRIKRLLGAV